MFSQMPVAQLHPMLHMNGSRCFSTKNPHGAHRTGYVAGRYSPPQGAEFAAVDSDVAGRLVDGPLLRPDDLPAAEEGGGGGSHDILAPGNDRYVGLVQCCNINSDKQFVTIFEQGIQGLPLNHHHPLGFGNRIDPIDMPTEWICVRST